MRSANISRKLLFLLAALAVLLPAVAYAEVVDGAGNVGAFTSIALDSSGNPYISYYDVTNGNLKYAYKDASGIWHTETVDTGGVGRGVGRYTSIALDSSGNPHISYHDASNGDLKYAYKTASGSWITETVDTGGTANVGMYTSIALDSSGNPHISYYDNTNGNLKYAYKTASGSWVTETVDSSGDVGSHTSIALDSSGNPHISYYDGTNGDLKYAYKTASGSWITETVDTGGTANVGAFTSIALDSSGNPHISYYDGTNGALKYAYKTASGSWVTETVDSSGIIVGMYTSIALDASGNPHISYYDYTNGALKYASDRGFNPVSKKWEWRITTVDSTGDVGMDTSIALDSSGNPHISYYDDTNGDLKYTTKQPTIVNLQGGITDLNGSPVATASMRVTVKDASGNAVYTETLNDVVTNGKFNILLGATQELKLWSDAKYNLIIAVDADSATFNTADVTFGDNSPSGDVLEFYA